MSERGMEDCNLEKLFENKVLTLQHVPGLGAWTFHLRIPGTKDLDSRWGFLKVSGAIDGHPVKNINLAPRTGEDKLLSINKSIRDAIKKSGGEKVTVTLFVHT
jgi:hypothetical protein